MTTSGLANAIKNLAVNANDAAKPDKIVLGRIIETLHENPKFNPDLPPGPDNPRYAGLLTIQVNDKFILTKGDRFLELTKYMQNQLATAKYIRLNDVAILLRINNGTKYILLDVM